MPLQHGVRQPSILQARFDLGNPLAVRQQTFQTFLAQRSIFELDEHHIDSKWYVRNRFQSVKRLGNKTDLTPFALVNQDEIVALDQNHITAQLDKLLPTTRIGLPKRVVERGQGIRDRLLPGQSCASSAEQVTARQPQV